MRLKENTPYMIRNDGEIFKCEKHSSFKELFRQANNLIN